MSPSYFNITVIPKVFAVSLFVLSENSQAQQMIVDDASLIINQSIQLDSWYGTEESSGQFGISLTPWLDIGPGLLFDSSSSKFEASSWFLEFKTVAGNLNENGYAYGLVFSPIINFEREIEEFYAYVPYTQKILNNSSLIHFNIGVEGLHRYLGYVGINSRWEWVITTGIRGDFKVSDTVTILSELFASGWEPPSFQAGFRYALIPSLLNMEITYGKGLQQGVDYPGFNFGLAFTPSRLW